MDTTSLAILPAAVTTAVLGTGAWMLLSKSKTKTPPGLIDAPSPPGHWLLGHIPYLGVKNAHHQFLQWADEFGPVYKLWVTAPTYVISDASLATLVLSRGPEYQPKSSLIYKQSLWVSFDHSSIFNEVDDSNPKWRRVRKTTAACFAVEHIKKLFPHILTTSNKMLDSWSKLLSPGPDGTPEGVVEIVSWTMRCIMDCMLPSAFGYDSKALDEGRNVDHEFLDVLHHAMEELSLRFTDPLRAPMQKLMPFMKSAREFNKLYARFRELNQRMSDQIQSKGSPAADDMTLGAALRRLLEPSADGPALTQDEMLGNLSIFIIGSFDTSSSALSWALYNIASHPDVQQRCIKDLYDVGLLHLAGQPTPRPVAWEDLTSMPYLQATLKESLRFSTTSATGSARQTTKDLTLGKYFIPKGSMVVVPLVCIHESKHNFTDARVFNPSRWLSTDGDKPTTIPATDKVEAGPTPTGNAANLSKSFLPFSTGPRDCVGQSLANITLRTIAISILSRFHLSVHPDTGTPEEVYADQMMVLVMVSGRPIKLVIKPHTQVPI